MCIWAPSRVDPQVVPKVNTIDVNTNSDREGFRLEGFDSPPPSILSVEDHLESGAFAKSAVGIKKLKQLNLQRMTASLGTWVCQQV